MGACSRRYGRIFQDLDLFQTPPSFPFGSAGKAVDGLFGMVRFHRPPPPCLSLNSAWLKLIAHGRGPPRGGRIHAQLIAILFWAPALIQA